jgi:hypothetical protein
MPARRFFLSIRRSRAAAGGLVARRFRGGCAACRIMSKRRASASSRLRACARWRWAVMTMMPSRVRREPAKRWSRSRTSAGNDGERRASNRSCTALATLLTFCPPGPEDRTKYSAISRSSRAIFAVTGIIADSYPGLSPSEIGGKSEIGREIMNNRPSRDLKPIKQIGGPR